MKTIYRAEDGTEFETEAECLAHESASQIFMWVLTDKTTSGVEMTSEVDCAKYVYLKGESAAKTFMDQCKGNGAYFNGIFEGDTGFYYWDDCDDTYRWLNPDELKAIAKLEKEIAAIEEDTEEKEEVD